MTFKERVDALKSKIQAKIKSESTADEIAEINDLVAELDALDADYTNLSQEHSKVKDTLVRMVTSEGSGDKPSDDSMGSKPKSIEECVAEVAQQGGN